MNPPRKFVSFEGICAHSPLLLKFQKICWHWFTCISDSGTGSTGKLIEQESAVDLGLTAGELTAVDMKSDGELSAVELKSAVVLESASDGIKCKETFSLPKKIYNFFYENLLFSILDQ